ncbi:Oidioi.mRNA.OKI2018_I69.XSR.g14266.t1.cds [Oikopleura dioica]|uniref:chitin synthase n=1 Tax=Oikopleura dioica TaxID=34765 RepID=A0ABN7SD69_OIKDI|nr:Oidioi.mRNA.OKI2018_I69.XSR.g14266.t1.cds [Oikopleura dioica]
MLRNDKVAAVCGRIHPVGGGWINWYQRFEYGVGHWLQKATEHVLGCVLCSPGCFSLMRVHHLRFNNVMARYRQYAETPMQKLQYDMGEDRWLCTLMLMQGGRIEYEAGSHCFTFAPEELEEFFKQRKRWGPSTTANIYDLIQQQWLARKNNPYISFPYVLYQGFNLIFTVIGLSTTLMMLSEAFNFAIKMPTDEAALAYIIICTPVVIFALVCRFYDNQNVQIGLASFLTFIYAILMVTVMIGLLVDAIECVADPNVLFFLALAAIYGIAALSHGEIVNLMCGIIYFMFIPSCFIFLQLYMVANLNDISWGTRQNAGEASKKKKDMGIFGGIMNSFCSMCMGESSCNECCCPNESKPNTNNEEDLELTRNSLKKDSIIKEEPKQATLVAEQQTQTDQSSEDNNDYEEEIVKKEVVHEDGWFDFSHRLRRHSDMELHSSTTVEAGEIKKRYTTAELGFNIRDEGFDYTKTTSVAQKKKSPKKLAPPPTQPVQVFTPLQTEKANPDSSTHTKRLTKRRVTNSLRKNTDNRQSVVSSKSACSLRKSLMKHNKSFNELISSQYKNIKKVLTIDIDDSSRDTELVKRSYLNYGGVTRKTMRKLFQVLNVSTITEPIHLSLLLEYFTYPTKSKSPVPRATHHETIKIRKIRLREYSECAMRGNLDYFSWFLEPNAPFEPTTRIYTLADPEYNFWKSLQDPANGHLKIVDSEYSDVDKERLQNERKKALAKFRNDIFLFYIVANILWMTIGLMLRQFGDRLLQIGYDAPDFCEPDTEAQISFSSFSHFAPRDSLLPGGPGLFPGLNNTEPDPTYQIEIQPLTLCFMAFYIVLIVIQFICMISHRISTFYHYMAHIRIPDERRTIEEKQLKLEKQRLKRVNEQPRDSEISGDSQDSAADSDDSLDRLADHVDKSGRRMSDESVFAEITHLKKGLNNPSFTSPADVEIETVETSFSNANDSFDPVNPYPTVPRGVKFAVGEEKDKTSKLRKTGAWALTKKSALKKPSAKTSFDKTPRTSGTTFSNSEASSSGTNFSSSVKPPEKEAETTSNAGTDFSQKQEKDPLIMFKDLDMGDSSTVRLPSSTMKKSNSTGTLF